MNHHRKIMTVASAVLLAAACAQSQIITAWTFDNLPTGFTPNPAPSTGSGLASTLGMNNSYPTPNAGGTTNISDVLSDPGSSSGGPNAWRVRGGGNGDNGWSSLAPIGSQGAEFDASTVGYNNIQLTFDLHTTAQAEANLEVLYTIDGSAWLNATLSYSGSGATVMNNSSSPNTVMGSFIRFQNTAAPWYNGITASFGSAANNDPNFGVRIVNASTGADDINQSGTAYNNSSGNWRYDNIVISSVPEPSALALAGLGFAGLLQGVRRNRRNS